MDKNANTPTKYVSSSKQMIDKLLYDNAYQKAFNMLISVLNNVDDNGKCEIIKYYDTVDLKIGV